MSNLTPSQVAVADQWLASLEEQIREPLANLRRMFDRFGDPAVAYVELARAAAELLDEDPRYRGNMAISYIAAMYLLSRERAE